MAEEGKLVQIRFSEPVLKQIEELRNESGNISMRQFFLNALSSYEVLKKAQNEGNSIFIQRQGGKRDRILLP